MECIGAIDNGYLLFFLLTFINSPGFGGLDFYAKTKGIAKANEQGPGIKVLLNSPVGQP